MISCLFLQIFAISETSHSGIVSDVCQLFSILVLLGWMAYVTCFFFLFRFFQIQSTEFGFRPVLSVDYPFSLPTIIMLASLAVCEVPVGILIIKSQVLSK